MTKSRKTHWKGLRGIIGKWDELRPTSAGRSFLGRKYVWRQWAADDNNEP